MRRMTVWNDLERLPAVSIGLLAEGCCKRSKACAAELWKGSQSQPHSHSNIVAQQPTARSELPQSTVVAALQSLSKRRSTESIDSSK